jgi:hypothetical protein
MTKAQASMTNQTANGNDHVGHWSFVLGHFASPLIGH